MTEERYPTFTEILNYWTFENRHKWFTQQGSAAQLEVDEEVTQKFKPTLLNLEKWCNRFLAEDDNSSHDSIFYDWCQHPHGTLAIIIILDQFSRHIYRERDLTKDVGLTNRCAIMLNDKRSLYFSKSIFLNKWEHILTEPQFMLACMPMRHAANEALIQYSTNCKEEEEEEERVAHLRFIMQAIDVRSQLQCDNTTLIQNFWKATNSRLSLLFKERSIVKHNNTSYLDLNKPFSFGGFCTDDLLDARYKSYTDYFNPVESPDLSTAVLHPVFKAVHNSATEFSKNQKFHYVSVSGGIDSIAVAFCLNYKYPGRVVAIHIDYGNRNESRAEAAITERWCIIQNIIFRKCVIPADLRREKTPRAEYEALTKKMRFDAYRTIFNEFGPGCIHIGHNCDDIRENVLNNIVRKTSLLDLSGMHPSNVIDNVQILRPLLYVSKEQIFDFGYKFQLWYHKDTTPRYCTRGMLRHEFMPLMQKIYNNNVLDSLNFMSEQSRELYEFTQLIWQPVLASVGGYTGQIQRIRKTIKDGGESDPTCLGLWLNYTSYVDYPKYFWKEILSMMCHAMGVAQIGSTAIESVLMTKLKSTKTSWLNLRKGLRTCLHKGELYLLHNREDRVGEDEYKEETVTFNIGESHTVKGWKITLSVVDSSDSSDKKVTFNSIMSGTVVYYIPYLVPVKNKSTVVPKYIISRDRKLTPDAFKKCDLDSEMKNMLPIVCLDRKSCTKDDIKVSDNRVVMVRCCFGV